MFMHVYAGQCMFLHVCVRVCVFLCCNLETIMHTCIHRNLWRVMLKSSPSTRPSPCLPPSGKASKWKRKMLPISIKNNGQRQSQNGSNCRRRLHVPLSPVAAQLAMGNSAGQWAMGSNTIKAIIDQKRNKTHTHTITETEKKKKDWTKTEPNNKTSQTICTKVDGILYTVKIKREREYFELHFAGN